MATVDLHVEEAGSGLPVVLLHAFPLHGAMWAAQREALSGSYRVVTPDLRGFGRSPLGGDVPSLDAMADDVAAVLDGLGFERVVLGGLSMGGYVAMAFLRRHPHRVRAVALVDTKAGADPDAGREKRLRIADRLATEGRTDALVEEVLPALTGPTTRGSRPEVGERVTGLVQAASPAAAAWAQRAMAARPDSLDTLATTTVPALVVLGDEDALATRADADAMVGALPDARLVVLDGSGHLTAMEVPEDLTGVLREFLEELG